MTTIHSRIATGWLSDLSSRYQSWPEWCSTLRGRIRQLACRYVGHQAWLVKERDHLSVICLHCGWESPGLDLHTAPVRWIWMREKWRIAQHARRFNLIRGPHYSNSRSGEGDAA